MRIMTYNIQSGRDAFKTLDLDKCLSVINEFNPDILSLNEVRMKTADIGNCRQADELAEKLGMQVFFAKAIDYMGGEYGVALLSKYPITEACAIPIPQLPPEKRDSRYEDRVLLKARLLIDSQALAVYVSHYGLSEAERENAVNLTLSELEKEKDPAIFMGDLNMKPDHPLIGRLKGVLTDTAAGASFFTFHALSPTQKIDYIFVKGGFRTENTFAPLTTASDHLPVIADVCLLHGLC